MTRQVLAVGVVIVIGCSSAPPTSNIPDPNVLAEVGKSCARNFDCESLICLPLGSGADVCTTRCAATDECLPGWTCAPPPLSELTDSVCSCTPHAEACDGQDNDCNGVIDDDPAASAGCGPNGVCRGGACACEAPRESCGSTCVDFAADVANCGKCGNVCPKGASCAAGACGCPIETPDVCGNVCVNKTSDKSNCGVCGTVCAATQSCIAGQCVCPGTLSFCSGVCVDTSTNTQNCGQCGNACTVTNATCSGGSCGCPQGTVVCGNACVDTQTDASNCGSCGSVCSGSCALGRCSQTLQTVTGSIGDVATDGVNVYYVDLTNSVLDQVPVSGGTKQLVASGQGQLYSIATDGSYVYFIANQTGASVRRVPVGGGTVTSLASSAPGGILLLTSTEAFFDGPSGGIAHVAKTGGSSSMAANFSTLGVYFAIDATNVYYNMGQNNNVVYQLPIGGSSTTQLGKVAGPITPVVTDGQSVWWINAAQYGGYSVQSTPVGGGTITTLCSGFGQPGYLLVLDGGYLYFVELGMGLLKVPATGGTVTLVSKDQPTHFALDGTSIYYPNPNLVKLTPK